MAQSVLFDGNSYAMRSAANGVSQNGQWTTDKGRLDARKSAIQRSVGS